MVGKSLEKLYLTVALVALWVLTLLSGSGCAAVQVEDWSAKVVASEDELVVDGRGSLCVKQVCVPMAAQYTINTEKGALCVSLFGFWRCVPFPDLEE